MTIETDPDKRGRDQDVIINLALKRLKNKGTVFISSYTGSGKSAMAIYLSITLKLKTIVICHLGVLLENNGQMNMLNFQEILLKFKC